MIVPRPYQSEAVEAVYEHLRTKDNNPCVVLPTGCHAKDHPILMSGKYRTYRLVISSWAQTQPLGMCLLWLADVNLWHGLRQSRANHLWLI